MTDVKDDLREKVIAEIRSVYESDDVSERAHREAAESAADCILTIPEIAAGVLMLNGVFAAEQANIAKNLGQPLPDNQS